MDAAVEPEPHHLQHFMAHVGIAPVKVRLLLEKGVVIILAGRRVPFPGAARRTRRSSCWAGPVRLGIAPDIPGVLGARARRSAPRRGRAVYPSAIPMRQGGRSSRRGKRPRPGARNSPVAPVPPVLRCGDAYVSNAADFAGPGRVQRPASKVPSHPRACAHRSETVPSLRTCLLIPGRAGARGTGPAGCGSSQRLRRPDHRVRG